MSDNLRPAPGFDDDTPSTFQADAGDLYRRGYSTPREEDTKTRWGDVGRAVGIGTLGVASAIPTLSEFATQGEVGGDTRRYLEGKSEELEQGMTPVAKRAMNAAILPTEGQESIADVGVGTSLGLQGAAALPSVIASIIPGGLAARMARGLSTARQAAIAGGVARGSAAVLGGADVTQQIFSTIDDMSDKELYDHSPAFKGYIDAGLSPKEARGRFNTDVAGVTPFLAGGISALLATPEAEMAANVAGVGVKKGLLKGALHGAIGEAKEEAIESGTGEFMAEQKLAEQNLGDRDWYNVLSKTVQGATIGAGVGGGTGGITNIGGKPENQKIDADQQIALQGQVDTQPAAPIEQAPAEPAPIPEATPAPPTEESMSAQPQPTPADLMDAVTSPSAPSKPGIGAAGQAVLDQRQAPVPEEMASSIAPGWDEDQDAADALAEHEAKWAALAADRKREEPVGNAGLNRVSPQSEPDLIQYDDGTTEEAKPLPLRGNKQPASARSKGWMTPATEKAIQQAEANRAARNQPTPSEEPSSSVQTEATKPSTDAVLNPETKKVKVGGWEFDVGARDAIAVKKPGGDFVNFYDRDQRKHYGRRGEAYLDEAADHGIPDVLQAKLSEYLKNKQTPEQFTESLNAPLNKQPSSSVQTDATSEVKGAIKPKRARRPAKQPAAQPDNGRVASSIPQLDDDSAKSRLKAASARIRNALNGKGRLKTSEVELPIADLVSQQDWVEPSRKEPALATNEPPVVVHVGGKFVLRDGNHRVSAMMDRGDTTAKVRLVELDPYGNSETTTAEPAEKAARSKAPTKTKSENALTTVATTEPTAENNTPVNLPAPKSLGRITEYTRARAAKQAAQFNETRKKVQETDTVAESSSGDAHADRKGNKGNEEVKADRARDAAHKNAFLKNPPTKEELYSPEDIFEARRHKKSDNDVFVRTPKQAEAVIARLRKMLKAAGALPGTIHDTHTGYTHILAAARYAVESHGKTKDSTYMAINNFIAAEKLARENDDFSDARKLRKEARVREQQLAEGTDKADEASVDHGELGNRLGRTPTGLEKARYEYFMDRVLEAVEGRNTSEVKNPNSLDELQEFATKVADLIGWPKLAELFPVQAQRAVTDQVNEAGVRQGGAIKRGGKAAAEPTKENKGTVRKPTAEEQERYKQLLVETAKRDAQAKAQAPINKADVPIWDNVTTKLADVKTVKEDRDTIDAVTSRINALKAQIASAAANADSTTIRQNSVLKDRLEQQQRLLKKLNNEVYGSSEQPIGSGMFGELPVQTKPKKQDRRQLYSMENSDKADPADLAEKVFGGAFGNIWTTSYRSTGDDVLDALQEASANGGNFDPFQEFAKTRKQQELFEKSPEEIKHQMMQEAVNRVREEFIEERDNEPSYPVINDRNGVRYFNHEKVQDPVVNIGRVDKLLSVKLPGAHRSKLDDFIRNLVNRLAGDVDVITLTDKDFNSVAKKHAAAFYLPGSETIVVPDSLFKRANFQAEQIILHEALHAALYHRVRGNNVAIHQLELLADYLAKKGFMPGAYMYADVHEFLSEVLSRGDLQEGLRRIELTPELAQILGIEPWRAKNLWQAIVQTFAKWLGYVGPYNALEGVLSVTDRIVREDTSVPIEFAANTSDHYFDKRYDDYYGDSKPLGFGYEPGPAKYYTNDGAVSKSEFGKGISRRGGRSRAGWGDQLPSIRQDDITSVVNNTAQTAKDHGQAFVNRMKRLAAAGVTLDQMRQSFAGLFVDKNGVDLLEKVVSAIQRMAPFAQKIREQSDELAQRFIALQKKDADGADDFTTLANDATNANVRLGPDPTGLNNKHLKNGGRNAQGKELLDRLQERYKALSPEWQQLYQDMSTYYRGVQNEHVRGIVDNRLKRYGIEPANRAQFIEKFVTGAELTNADKELFKNNEHALKRLKAVRELRVIQGDYFPLMRYGKFVVNTNQKISDHMGGVEIEPGKVEFRAKTDQAARAMAERFAGDVGLPQTNWQKSPLSQANDYGYIVSVQTRGAHFFESEAEAIAWRRKNADEFDEISEVSPIRETGQQGADLTTAQLNSLQATVRNSNYSDEEKEDMLDMLQQGSAVLMSGNRIQKRSIARRKVMGASKDFGRNVVQYGEAVSNRLAQLEFRPEIDDALDGMRELNKNLMDKRQPERTALINEITKRIDSNVVNAKEPGKFMKDLMTLTFLGRLASPMYSVINGMQPWMVTYPVLAGRYGPARAAAMLTQAYGSIGFTEQALAGLKNTYLAGKSFTNVSILNTEDVAKSIREKLKSQSDGAELNKVIEMLLERGAMSQGGFELAPSIAQGRGLWGSTLARVDRIARQLPQAVEDVNRAVSAIAAYRLARASMSEEKAREFAFSTVMNTQGDYSGVNAPRFFNNPVLRPAVQFKKYAQMMVYLLADMTGKAFGPNTPREERAVALKQLGSVMGVQIAMAGALSLPGIEIAKIGFMVASALGFGGGWDDEEEKLRKYADETFGKSWGEMLTRGVVSRALNIDLSQRLSLADMMTFGEPNKYDKDGLQSYLWQMATGAPGGTLEDVRHGVTDAVKGDWAAAAGRLLPVKIIADAFKAANGYSEGKVTPIELGMNIFGVKSGRQAEQNRTTGNSIRNNEKIAASHKELTDAYLKAKSAGERVKLRAKIIEFNKTAPLRQKVFPNSLDKVRQRIEAERVS